ncbi:MAG: M14 family metallopeptidase [Anaerolineaceae bacterium]|nr:M14 family metallopeptidase [Anaerolineaceae bacterium]
MTISDYPSKAESVFAVELAGFLGFHSLYLDFPLVREQTPSDLKAFTFLITQGTKACLEPFEDGLRISLTDLRSARRILKKLMKNFKAFVPHQTQGLTEENIDFASDHAAISSQMPQTCLGVDTFLLQGHAVQDLDGDYLPDAVLGSISIPEGADKDCVSAACNLAAVIGAQTTLYRYPLLGKSCEYKIRFRRSGSVPKAELKAKTLTFSGKGLNAFTVCYLQKTLPDYFIRKDGGLAAPLELTLSQWLEQFKSSLEMKTSEGQFAYLEAFKHAFGTDYQCLFNPEAKIWNAQKGLCPPEKLLSYKDEKLVWQKHFDLPWETDTLSALLRQKLYPFLKQGDRVSLFGSLSEDQSVRRSLENEIKQTCLDAGAQAEVVLISAYKQGYSWIDECVIPQLLKYPQAKKIKIAFKPFLKSGQKNWLDENGAVPAISSERKDNPDLWFDLPLRFLQELYPIDDTIAEKTGIARSNITFSTYEGEADISYLVSAEDEKGNLLFEHSMKAHTSERPYLGAYPEIGKVHPATGHILVKVNSSKKIDEDFLTDLEQVWNAYQDEVLPALRKFILEKTKGNPKASDQPLFSSLVFEVTLSEPDFDLPSRKDRISSLDALHEDLYFVSLDFCRSLGLRITGQKLDSPGLVLPVVRKGQAKPFFKASLYDRLADRPQIASAKGSLQPLTAKENVEVRAVSLQGQEDALCLSLEVNGPKELQPVLDAFGAMLGKGLLAQSPAGLGLRQVNLKLNGRSCQPWLLPEDEAKPVMKPLSIEEVDLKERQVIGYQEYVEIIDQLARIPRLRVYPVAFSYQGRTIHAIELLPQLPGWRPRTRWITEKPSLYINARHHANEVSGTNANFMIIRELLLNPRYKDLPQKLNLVFVPFENADGAAIHYMLQKDNPRWKLHAARFNALGLELAYAYFDDETIHSECMAFTRTWRKWLPDVIVDDHGVPSHEWDQQFSGYTSPWFKGFWMPRALLYSYFFHVQGEPYQANLSLNKAMEHVVAESLKTDAEISELNKEWRERFEKYAHSWMPGLFPANYYQDMISYWIPSAYNPQHRYAAVRYPWVTGVSFVSEVSDETAQGDYLELCARAHLVHDLAIIDWLSKAQMVFDDKQEWQGNTASLSRKRKRPVLFVHSPH